MRAAETDATQHKVSLLQCRLKQKNENRKQHQESGSTIEEETRKQDTLSGAISLFCSDSLQITRDKSVRGGKGWKGEKKAGEDRI